MKLLFKAMGISLLLLCGFIISIFLTKYMYDMLHPVIALLIAIYVITTIVVYIILLNKD